MDPNSTSPQPQANNPIPPVNNNTSVPPVTPVTPVTTVPPVAPVFPVAGPVTQSNSFITPMTTPKMADPVTSSAAGMADVVPPVAPVAPVTPTVPETPVKPEEEMDLDSNPFFKMPETTPVSSSDVKPEMPSITQINEPVSTILEKHETPAADNNSVLSGMFPATPTTTTTPNTPKEPEPVKNFWETPAVKAPEPATGFGSTFSIPKPITSMESTTSQPLVIAPEVKVEPKSEAEKKVFPVYVSPTDQGKSLPDIKPGTSSLPGLPEIKPVAPSVTPATGAKTEPVEGSHSGRIIVMIIAVVVLGILAIVLGLLLYNGVVK